MLKTTFYDGPDIHIQKEPGTGLPVIKLSDLWGLLAGGVEDKEIFARFPDLKPKKLVTARNYFHAITSPPFPEGGLRVLCDENISSRHLRACQEMFGYARSIAFDGMIGSSDHDVWAHAISNRYDLIVSRDKRNREARDLTHIAVHGWRHMLLSGASDASFRLPHLLHLMGDAAEPELFPRILSEHLVEIFNRHSTGRTPVMRINQAGVQTEIHAEDLVKPVIDGPIPQNISRQEQWARWYLQKTVPQNRWYDREDPAIKHRKRRITRAVAIATRGRTATLN